jgi:hypothetical protein
MGFMIGEGTGASVQEDLSRPIPGLVWGKPPVAGSGKLSNQPLGGQFISSARYFNSNTMSGSSLSNYSGGGSRGGKSATGQVLTNLYNALVQLGLALGSYKKS